MSSRVYEFDATMTVTKRLQLAGPSTREAARKILLEAILSDMNPDLFIKRGDDGLPVQKIAGGRVTLMDADDAPPDKRDDTLELTQEAARAMVRAEAEYRKCYEHHGGDDIRTGMAWDQMRGASEVLRSFVGMPAEVGP